MSLKNAGAVLVVAVAPGEDFVGGDFDESPLGCFVVAKIPFVFVVEIVGEDGGGFAVGGMGFAFDDDDVLGVGQGEGDALVAVHVEVFLGVGAGAEVDFAFEPDIPDGDEVRPAVMAGGGEPNGGFTAESRFDGAETGGVAAFHGDIDIIRLTAVCR